MKFTNTFLFCLALGVAYAQPVLVPPPITISPLEVTAVVDKANFAPLTWPITVSLPPGSNQNVWVQASPFPAFMPVGVSISPAGALVMGNLPATFELKINPSQLTLDVGKYPFITIIFTYTGNGSNNWSQSVNLSLEVTDSRLSQLPSSTQRQVPHIAAGGGWRTTLRFVNPGNDTAVMRVGFTRTTGTPLFLTANGVYGSDTLVTIAPKGVSLLTLTDPTVPGTNVTTGHAEVIPQINGSGVGFSIAYEFPNSRGEFMEAATPGANPNLDTLNLVYDLRGNSATGIALSNAMNFSQFLELTFYDDLGKIAFTTRTSLVAKGQSSFTVDRTSFPALEGKHGILVVKGQFKALSGLSLRFSPSGGFVPLTSF